MAECGELPCSRLAGRGQAALALLRQPVFPFHHCTNIFPCRHAYFAANLLPCDPHSHPTPPHPNTSQHPHKLVVQSVLVGPSSIPAHPHTQSNTSHTRTCNAGGAGRAVGAVWGRRGWVAGRGGGQPGAAHKGGHAAGPGVMCTLSSNLYLICAYVTCITTLLVLDLLDYLGRGGWGRADAGELLG